MKLERTARFAVFGSAGSGQAKAAAKPPQDKAKDAGKAKGDKKEAKSKAKGKEVAPKGSPAPNGGNVDTDAMNAAVTKQGSIVKQMKKDLIGGDELKAAVDKLLELKATLAAALASQTSDSDAFDRKAFDDTILSRMFVVPAFEIHGGSAGLYDLGPPACGLKAKVVATWREHFVLKENMLEMDCTNLTPEEVLKTSGHVERFTDLMVKDIVDGECLRADKLLEDWIDKLLADNPTMSAAERDEHQLVQRQADAYSPKELHDILQKYKVTSPAGNGLTEPFPFNLMFQTTIGPEGSSIGYLRPETAQGLFVNFKRLLNFNNQRVPFAAAQVGLGFRNEISPHNGLLRVREFCMAEIEHFVNPEHKEHARFSEVKDKRLVLFGRDQQLGTGKTVSMTIGEAVASGLVNNETLGYFMARTQLFLEKIGMDPERMRFRQHLATEMAHYASDCWDMEIKTSYGWVECVGHADRACYDLQVHAAKTNTPMLASQRLDTPREVTVYKLNVDRKKIGMTHKADQKKVVAALEKVSEDEPAVLALDGKLNSSGEAEVEGFKVTREMASWKASKKMMTEEKFTPSVVEPSFGIGRILYALLEHSFYMREDDEQRAVFSFKPTVAPIQVGIFPLSANAGFHKVCRALDDECKKLSIQTRTDMGSQSLGRRYSRSDELGIPYGVTVDFQTLEDDTVTLRERDTMSQIRLPKLAVLDIAKQLLTGQLTWEKAQARFPPHKEQVLEGGGKMTTTAACH
ncbi:unnamed protein product [Chrysoparadoxa australica]